MFPSVVKVGREIIIVESAVLSSGVGYDWGELPIVEVVDKEEKKE